MYFVFDMAYFQQLFSCKMEIKCYNLGNILNSKTNLKTYSNISLLITWWHFATDTPLIANCYFTVKGKYLSEALILASTNPQYDDRLFIELQVQYMKTPSSEHVVYINCSECQNRNNFFFFGIDIQNNLCTQFSELVFFTYWTRNSINNLLSYCGLVYAKISFFWKRFTCNIIISR